MLNKQMLERVQMAALLISLVGGAFKLMHWPGANIMLIVGMGTLINYYILSGFLPAAKNQKAVMTNYSRNFSAAVLIAGILFYIMHWPNAKIMLMVGAAGVVLSFVLQMTMGDKGGEE